MSHAPIVCMLMIQKAHSCPYFLFSISVDAFLFSSFHGVIQADYARLRTPPKMHNLLITLFLHAPVQIFFNGRHYFLRYSVRARVFVCRVFYWIIPSSALTSTSTLVSVVLKKKVFLYLQTECRSIAFYDLMVNKEYLKKMLESDTSRKLESVKENSGAEKM